LRKVRLLLVSGAAAFVLAAVPVSAGAAPSRTRAGGGLFVPAPLPPSGGPVHAGLSPLTDAIRVKGSGNWSGYAQVAKTNIFTSVTDTWRVPTVSTATSGLQVSSDWVGIGGFKDSTLVQAGTSADNDNGVPVYTAWTEIIPAAEVTLPMTVNPGDSITTVVKETAPGTWSMQVTDNTSHVSQGRTVPYSSSGLSAEAIHERATLCAGSSCSLGTLATTTNLSFDPGQFTSVFQATLQPLLVPGVQSEKPTRTGIRIKTDKLYELEMISRGVIAVPSLPDADGDGFTVTDGGAPPPSPAT
jgi:hypothetical protein